MHEEDDARCLVDETHLESVFTFFAIRTTEAKTQDAVRELEEELTRKELAIQEAPILSAEEFEQIQVRFVKTLQQAIAATGKGTSAREEASDPPSRRQFDLCVAEAPDEIFQKLVDSSDTRVITAEEVSSTRGGASKGVTPDGVTIADNFIW